VSGAPFTTLNISLHVGDDQERVLANRAIIKQALGSKRLVSCRQVHGNSIHQVKDLVAADLEVDGYDALITAIPEVLLMIQQADCQAVLLFDPICPAVGAVHVGWRGSVAEILPKTLAAMHAAFGTRPRNLIAVISPSLGPCCAEFVHFQNELPQAFQAYQVRPNYFDFWLITRDQLLSSGVAARNITLPGLCTRCSPEFFSYRRHHTTGRFASVIGLV
jgi:YfiH family protein